ncbi:neutral zinc metallopeptidase [Acrocarpospora sp. B8E8]|uniref:neutral zinc metallopeptidase n=1 Tax=Acrocarpospora sp. B8E8 TaxID=3153572 RepID=UPI00325F82FE
MIIGGLLGLGAFVFAVLIVGAALTNNTRDYEADSPVSLPTSRPDGPRGTAEPNGPRGTTDPGDPARPAVRLDRSLKNNTLYQVGALPKTRCPAGSANIYNSGQLKALIMKTSLCMGKAWKPRLEQAGIPFTPPKYAIVARSGRGACGDFPMRGTIVPYYCPSNMTIYASTSAMASGRGDARGYGDLVSWHGGIIGMMAHEYGHHIQQLSGLSQTRWEQSRRASSESQRLAISRRFELQANCLSGMFMRSVSATYPIPAARRQNLFYFFSNVGDWPGYPRDHGSPKNSGAWFRQGWQRQQAYQCNTWAVGSSTVS